MVPDHLLSTICIPAADKFEVKVKFQVFHLEASESCADEFIELRDGPYGFSPLIYKGCGKNSL